MSLQQAITEFRGQFRGAVIEPRRCRVRRGAEVYIAMIDRKPRLIARCTDVADVMAAVRMAKANACGFQPRRRAQRGNRIRRLATNRPTNRLFG